MTESEDFATYSQDLRAAIEQRLEKIFDACNDTIVRRVAEYVTLGGGHRWRGMMAIAAGEIFSPDAKKINLPVACGVELAHAASMLLDDLPSMDNANMRRGKRCAHHVFPTWAVDMAPSYLVALAFQAELDNPLASPDHRVASALALSHAGLNMAQGQEMDLNQNTHGDVEGAVLQCYQQKSAALYAATTKTGALLCGADARQCQLLFECGAQLGMSYQFLDDVADVIGDSESIGKETGMDKEKTTSVELYGVDESAERSQKFVETALIQLNEFGPEADHLRLLVSRASWASV